MAEDGTIDTEALQAQIDLSMSLTHQLVSSWIKPSQKNRSSYNHDLEAELKDYMRQPPRLGVGAAIPESSGMTRETARLKGQLVGNKNKRLREDGETKAQSSSDEGESKASSIRKKAKHDPFAGTHGKKNKKTLQESQSTGSGTVAQNSVAKPEDDPVVNRSNPFTITGVQAAKPDVILSVPLVIHDQAGEQNESTSKETEIGSTGPSGKSTPCSPSMAKPQTPQSPKNHRSTVSVLNLDGPVGDNDSGDDEPQASPSKKKRKRRKKKKHVQLISEG